MSREGVHGGVAGGRRGREEGTTRRGRGRAEGKTEIQHPALSSAQGYLEEEMHTCICMN